MKAISLTQPWATLVAIGAKQIETRSWSTPYRGELAIHAAKGLGSVGGKRGLAALCGTEPFCSVLTAWGTEYAKTYRDLADMVARPLTPFGAVIAIAELVDVQPMRRRSRYGFQVIGKTASEWQLTDQELAFGDYGPGRYAWLLRNVRMLETPVPAVGALGLWEWDEPN